MRFFHKGLSAMGMNPSWSWCLAITGLVVLIRICLIPLFVKQIRSMRSLQLLQPEIKKIQERYKGDRERASQELMKLYKEHKTNPLSSLLPDPRAVAVLLRAVLGAEQRLQGARPSASSRSQDVDSIDKATLLRRETCRTSSSGPTRSTVQIVTVVMILAMSASQFYIQRMLMTKNMPTASQAGNPFMQQQKIMLYLFPIMFAVFGINFPVGVLLYWLVSNAWSVGQQLYVIRRMPAVGSPAHEAMVKRKDKKAARKGGAGPMTTKAAGLDDASQAGGASAGARLTRGRPARAKPPGRAAAAAEDQSQRSGSKKR